LGAWALRACRGKAFVRAETRRQTTLSRVLLAPTMHTPNQPAAAAVLAHDLETITFYDSKGEFVGVRRAGSGKPINVSGAAESGASCCSYSLA
jgi:hypothetical protein